MLQLPPSCIIITKHGVSRTHTHSHTEEEMKKEKNDNSMLDFIGPSRWRKTKRSMTGQQVEGLHFSPSSATQSKPEVGE